MSKHEERRLDSVLGRSVLRRGCSEVRQVLVQLVNLASNLLGDDTVSRALRRTLLELLGARFGDGTDIDGGTYFGGARIVTGERCHINRGCHFDFNGPIRFGDDVAIAHGVTFVTAQHTIGSPQRRSGPHEGAAITVGDGAWIGANATVLGGITIGPGAVVGAASLVLEDVPAHTVVAGVPARLIRKLDEP